MDKAAKLLFLLPLLALLSIKQANSNVITPGIKENHGRKIPVQEMERFFNKFGSMTEKTMPEDYLLMSVGFYPYFGGSEEIKLHFNYLFLEEAKSFDRQPANLNVTNNKAGFLFKHHTDKKYFCRNLPSGFMRIIESESTPTLSLFTGKYVPMFVKQIFAPDYFVMIKCRKSCKTPTEFNEGLPDCIKVFHVECLPEANPDNLTSGKNPTPGEHKLFYIKNKKHYNRCKSLHIELVNYMDIPEIAEIYQINSTAICRKYSVFAPVNNNNSTFGIREISIISSVFVKEYNPRPIKLFEKHVLQI